MDVFGQVSTDTTPSMMLGPVSDSDTPDVFGDIYEDSNNIAIWRRELSAELAASVDELVTSRAPLQLAMSVTPLTAQGSVREALGGYSCATGLNEDIASLVEMFAYLFDLDSVGLRLTTLDYAMCPRFHVDKVPCRLVTTYQGLATQWLPNHLVDRTKLGAGNNGLPDELSGIHQSTDDIQQLSTGDVVLIKGELWEGNEGSGLVHRSPLPKPGTKRLVLTLDFL